MKVFKTFSRISRLFINFENYLDLGNNRMKPVKTLSRQHFLISFNVSEVLDSAGVLYFNIKEKFSL